MSLTITTAGISCTISQRLSGAMEDCSIDRSWQPRTLCRQRCWITVSWRMFGSMWNRRWRCADCEWLHLRIPIRKTQNISHPQIDCRSL